jgi:hypothetical protein
MLFNLRNTTSAILAVCLLSMFACGTSYARLTATEVQGFIQSLAGQWTDEGMQLLVLPPSPETFVRVSSSKHQIELSVRDRLYEISLDEARKYTSGVVCRFQSTRYFDKGSDEDHLLVVVSNDTKSNKQLLLVYPGGVKSIEENIALIMSQKTEVGEAEWPNPRLLYLSRPGP